MFQISRLFFITILGVGLVNSVSLQKDLSLSIKEKQTLDKFREQVTPLLSKDFMRSDISLIRWLRATNFNINKAEALLKQNIRWRQEKKIDTIRFENFDDMLQDFPSSVDTEDKENRPIGTIDIYNNWDIRQAALSGRGPRLLRYLDFLMDNVTMQVFERQQKGMNVTQWKVLANADGFNMIRHGCPLCIPLWVQFLSSLENHFQGWMDELIVIEAPQAVHTIIDILRPFLSQSTRDSLRIFSPNKREWMKYMDQRISREERRPAYGGKKPQVEKD